ncbi:MAG: serine/threonine protein kinase [Kofleriaceae bacterium]|nr:serine/threonine protein kinase [Kofleriaceae bacterium]
MSILLGRTIAGRYVLDSLIGSGGMGEIYLAHDETLERKVAVKVLLSGISQRSDSEARFRREAKIGAQLSHPNIVRIYDFGSEQGVLYLVMELLEGQDLGDYLLENPPLSVGQTLELAQQISSAMHCAHQMQLVHRDLKPENIFLLSTAPLVSKVVDFGMALALEGPPDIQQMTQEGLVSGTPKYMAPEQLRGSKPQPASDVYGLACVMFSALTGQTPYTCESLGQIAAHHLFANAPQIPDSRIDVPPVVRELLQRCFAKDPLRRPTMAQIRDRVQAVRKSYESPHGSPHPIEKFDPDSLPAKRNGVSRVKVCFVGEFEDSLCIAVAAAGMEIVGESELSAGDVLISLGQGIKSLPRYAERRLIVIVDTVPGDMERISQLLRAGVQEVVPRPTKPDELVRKIRRSIRSLRHGQ